MGWLRRLELENEKKESKKRKLEEDRRRKEANKLQFLRKFYPNISTTPGVVHKGQFQLRKPRKRGMVRDGEGW